MQTLADQVRVVRERERELAAARRHREQSEHVELLVDEAARSAERREADATRDRVDRQDRDAAHRRQRDVAGDQVDAGAGDRTRRRAERDVGRARRAAADLDGAVEARRDVDAAGIGRARQAEADQILAFIRDLQIPGGTFNVPKDTPIMLAGDANLVGLKNQYHTLVEGSIQDEATYGKAFSPDWDGTPLQDLHPRHFQRPHTYTWRGNGFFPGRLDYVFYTDSVLKIGRHFVFDTVGLPKATLQKYNLQEMDAPDTYKHMPLVVDMILE